MVNFSVIIPNYNGAKFLASCLESLHIAINHCPASKFEIILVDNGSTDKSCSIFTHFFKFVPLSRLTSAICQLPSNLGFAAAVNRGIKKARYKYVVVCNNDLTLDKFWFRQIYNTIREFPHAACYCGTVLNQTGIESQGISFDYSGKCLQNHHGQKLSTDNSKLKTEFVWGSSAALVVYHQKILKKLNYFREIYFAYLEDVDLAFRLNQKGYHTILNPRAICHHLGGGTSDNIRLFRQYYIFRNWFIFIIQNYSFSQIVNNFPIIFLERLRNLSFLLKSL